MTDFLDEHLEGNSDLPTYREMGKSWDGYESFVKRRSLRGQYLRHLRRIANAKRKDNRA